MYLYVPICTYMYLYVPIVIGTMLARTCSLGHARSDMLARTCGTGGVLNYVSN